MIFKFWNIKKYRKWMPPLLCPFPTTEIGHGNRNYCKYLGNSKIESFETLSRAKFSGLLYSLKTYIFLSEDKLWKPLTRTIIIHVNSSRICTCYRSNCLKCVKSLNYRSWDLLRIFMASRLFFSIILHIYLSTRSETYALLQIVRQNNNGAYIDFSNGDLV